MNLKIEEQSAASNWIVRLSTGVIVVRAWTRQAAIKRAIQEEFIRVGGKVLFDRMGVIGKMHVAFESCEPRTWWDAEQGYEIDFDDTDDGESDAKHDAVGNELKRCQQCGIETYGPLYTFCCRRMCSTCQNMFAIGLRVTRKP